MPFGVLDLEAALRAVEADDAYADAGDVSVRRATGAGA